MYKESPIYINTLNWNVLFKDWYDGRQFENVRKFFKRPTLKFIYKYRERMYCHIPPIFRFQIDGLMWKTKYGEYRHEEDPTIILTILGWTFVWRMSPKDNTGEDISTPYYETVLWFNDYYKKYHNIGEVLYRVIRGNTWSRGVHDNTEINCVDMLTPLGKQIYTSYKAHLDNSKS